MGWCLQGSRCDSWMVRTRSDSQPLSFERLVFVTNILRHRHVDWREKEKLKIKPTIPANTWHAASCFNMFSCALAIAVVFLQMHLWRETAPETPQVNRELRAFVFLSNRGDKWAVFMIPQLELTVAARHVTIILLPHVNVCVAGGVSC